MGSVPFLTWGTELVLLSLKSLTAEFGPNVWASKQGREVLASRRPFLMSGSPVSMSQ